MGANINLAWLQRQCYRAHINTGDYNMKTVEEIKERIEQILNDDRMCQKPASVQINAPLALIQCNYEGWLSALKWVLSDQD